jgi:hypothetical protein
MTRPSPAPPSRPLLSFILRIRASQDGRPLTEDEEDTLFQGVCCYASSVSYPRELGISYIRHAHLAPGGASPCDQEPLASLCPWVRAYLPDEQGVHHVVDATEQDRENVRHWLERWPPVSAFTVGPLDEGNGLSRLPLVGQPPLPLPGESWFPALAVHLRVELRDAIESRLAQEVLARLARETTERLAEIGLWTCLPFGDRRADGYVQAVKTGTVCAPGTVPDPSDLRDFTEADRAALREVLHADVRIGRLSIGEASRAPVPGRMEANREEGAS